MARATGSTGAPAVHRPAAYQPGEPAGSDAAYPPDGPAQRDGRYADPRAPRGRRHRNVPPESADPGSYQDRPGPGERGAYRAGASRTCRPVRTSAAPTRAGASGMRRRNRPNPTPTAGGGP